MQLGSLRQKRLIRFEVGHAAGNLESLIRNLTTMLDKNIICPGIRFVIPGYDLYWVHNNSMLSVVSRFISTDN